MHQIQTDIHEIGNYGCDIPNESYRAIGGVRYTPATIFAEVARTIGGVRYAPAIIFAEVVRTRRRYHLGRQQDTSREPEMIFRKQTDTGRQAETGRIS